MEWGGGGGEAGLWALELVGRTVRPRSAAALQRLAFASWPMGSPPARFVSISSCSHLMLAQWGDSDDGRLISAAACRRSFSVIKIRLIDPTEMDVLALRGTYGALA